MTDVANDASPYTPEMIAETFGEPEPVADSEAKVDAPVAEAPKPDAPKEKSVSERITSAKRMQMRVEAQRAETAREKASVAAERAAIAAEKEEIRLFEQDPAAFTAKKGWTAKQHAEFLEKYAGTHKPEAIADRKLSAQEQRIADLEAKLAAKEQTEAQASLTAQQQHAGKVFVEDIAKDAALYPHLTQEYDEAGAVRAAFGVLNEVLGKDRDGNEVTRLEAFRRAHGRGPTHNEIAEHLDALAKAKIEARNNSAWRKQGDAPTSGSQPSLGESKSVPPVIKGTSPRSLSRADASQRAAPPRDTKWSQEAADAESLRVFEKMMAKG